MIRLEMKNYNTILTKKQQNIAALSSGRIVIYEYPTDEMLPDQSRVIEQAKFTYCPLGKAFEKQKQLKTKESTRPRISL